MPEITETDVKLAARSLRIAALRSLGRDAEVADLQSVEQPVRRDHARAEFGPTIRRSRKA
jgi:hypothetical protein